MKLQLITVTATQRDYIHRTTLTTSHSIKKNYGENIIKKKLTWKLTSFNNTRAQNIIYRKT